MARLASTSATAAVVLLAGVPAARTDEVAELRAKQDLLKQRIEQLAARGGGAIPAGTTMLGGSFPRSFLIPGTDTSIRVGGFIDETFDYYFQNGPPTGNPSTAVGATGNLESQALDQHLQIVPGLTPTAVPPAGTPFGSNAVLAVPGKPGFGAIAANITHSRGNGISFQTPRESRLNIETRTPSAWGESRTFVELDFAGCNNFTCQTLLHFENNLVPRLRYAYATLGGFLAGKANSNFRDSDSEPETLDFGGPAGLAGVTRIPQIRYTVEGPGSSAWAVSLETPNTDLITPAGLVEQDTNGSGAGTNTSPAAPTNAFAYFSNVYGLVSAGTPLGTNPAINGPPDVTLSSYWSQPWGHVDFRLVGRDLKVNDGRFFSKSYFGYGGGISGDVKPGWFGWQKDDFQWEFTAGNGLGRYLYNSTNGALATNYLSTPTSQAQANNIIFSPISAVGASLGYQHWWSAQWRSTLAYGYNYYGVPSQLIGASQSVNQNKVLQTAHFNLIFSPAAFIDTGVEYTWGQRYTVANIYGTEQALIGKFRVKF